MVCGCFDLLFRKLSGVVDHFVVHWLGCCHCGLVRDHEKVVDLVALVLYESSVNDRAGAWVLDIIAIVLVEESVVDVPVHEAVDDARVVTLLVVLNHLGNVRHFELEALFLESGTSDTVSVDNDLVGQGSIVHLLIIPQGFDYEILEDFGPSFCRDHLLLVFSESFFFPIFSPWEIMGNCI